MIGGTGFSGLRTAQCKFCKKIGGVMTCACRDVYLCYSCCLSLTHDKPCQASTAAINGLRSGRRDYPLS